MKKFYDLWQEIKKELKLGYNRETYLSNFDKINDIYKIEKDIVFLIAPSNLQKEKFNSFYSNKINNLARRLYNDKISFQAITEEDIKNEKKEQQELNKIIVDSYGSTNLNEKYLFDNFIGGGSNEYAIMIAKNIAKNPGKENTPFYLFGGVGLGKTHLMQAIGNEILKNYPNQKVLYTDTNKLIQEYVFYAQNKKYSLFDQKYEQLDVLLIDDIQMLSGANSTQSAFFKIFKKLKDDGKQIILTSDCHPRDLKDIMTRLTSRFAENLLASISIPDYDQRLKILELELKETYPEKVEKIPKTCLSFIAENFKTNVRELKGALKTTMLYCKMKNEQYTLQNFQDALNMHLSSKKTTSSLAENNYDMIISVVANYYAVDVSDVLGKSRKEKYTLPRHIAMFLIKRLYDIPYTKIGSIFSGRDHSTVTSAIEKIDRSLETDIELSQSIDNLLRKISNGDK